MVTSLFSLLLSLAPEFTIVRLRYQGGGNWYWGPSALPNLLTELEHRTTIRTRKEEVRLKPTSPELFRYPIAFITGHGPIGFTDEEVLALRRYLKSGGFLIANDSYGMDRYFRKEIKRILPESELVELPFDHEIYHIFYDFPHGLPKIHKHDGKPPQGFGVYYHGRLVCFYAYESDIGDGWEDYEVYKDPPEKHEAAIRMGINIIIYALTH
ncbi:hypothetical protein DRP53_01815 [candidate division WOR-3 bacterium]|uniref:DUF4159 domain-containing protein n=1 Tax=candidate division WOR-3 bacterium TaxID=2052148 RepID=A0A660SKR4_UNCW3|nr:MAG: hypothetical protein DRP53_01815 [candidate division WOR-3 bacterium]